MAMFQFNNFTLPYEIEFGPFSFDLVLLQSSKTTTEFWRDLRKDLAGVPPAGGRIVLVDWSTLASARVEASDVFSRLMTTLGIHNARVVGFDDAADLISAVQAIDSLVFTKTLLYPAGGPKGVELQRAVRNFCGL